MIEKAADLCPWNRDALFNILNRYLNNIITKPQFQAFLRCILGPDILKQVLFEVAPDLKYRMMRQDAEKKRQDAEKKRMLKKKMRRMAEQMTCPCCTEEVSARTMWVQCNTCHYSVCVICCAKWQKSMCPLCRSPRSIKQKLLIRLNASHISDGNEADMPSLSQGVLVVD